MDVFGHLDTNLVNMMGKIKHLDNREQDQPLTFADRFERLQAKKDLSKVHSWIDSFWGQRANQHWIQGDYNTKFFQKGASS